MKIKIKYNLNIVNFCDFDNFSYDFTHLPIDINYNKGFIYYNIFIKYNNFVIFKNNFKVNFLDNNIQFKLDLDSFTDFINNNEDLSKIKELKQKNKNLNKEIDLINYKNYDKNYKLHNLELDLKMNLIKI